MPLQHSPSHPIQDNQDTPTEKYKIWLLVRRDLNMPKGKIGSQCSHGMLRLLFGDLLVALTNETARGEGSAWEEVSFGANLLDWYRDDHTTVALRVDTGAELDALQQQIAALNLPHKHVIDNGTTMFDNVKTKTVLAIGPAFPSQVQSILGHLKPL